MEAILPLQNVVFELLGTIYALAFVYMSNTISLSRILIRNQEALGCFTATARRSQTRVFRPFHAISCHRFRWRDLILVK